MAQHDLAQEKSTSDKEDELELEPHDEAADDEAARDGEDESGLTEPSTRKWAIRGAVLGAVAGSVAGAGVGALVARRPEALKQAKDAISGNSRQVVRAAAVAAAEVVTSKGLNELVTGGGDGDRSQLMKQSAREAGAAAAQAARDAIISLRRDAA